MKWFSIKTNPAAIYLPQFITVEEEGLLFRSLKHAIRTSDNRGKASGAVDTAAGGKPYVRLDQEATIRLLKQSTDSGKALIKSIRATQDSTGGANPNRLRTWEGGKTNYSEAEWIKWWRNTAKLSPTKRLKVVGEYEKTNISKRTYGNSVKSSVIGNSGRDANNSWARKVEWNESFPHDYQRIIPILQRIDRAFKIALPERYAIQREYVDRIHPDFRIADTVFTTVTVNANFRTALHRDEGNLRQGFSNLMVLCNGKRYEGGHFILPEFGAEFSLKPRDLLFVQNDEYLHSNTPIVHRDPGATRMSLVCYVRESFLFSGTPRYENLRRDFVLAQKKVAPSKRVRARRWESNEWYLFLKQALNASGQESLVEAARRNKLLNAECLYLAAKWEEDSLFDLSQYCYVAELPRPSLVEFTALEALFSVIHFRTARQDQVIEKGQVKDSSDDGPLYVDSLFLDNFEGERWGISYSTSEAGAAKFNNNRFNVQGVAPLEFFPPQIEKLTRDAYEWLKSCWDANRRVWLVAVPTGIPEAPYRMAFTTNSHSETKSAALAKELRLTKFAFYEAASSISDRSSPLIPGRSEMLYDLGWKRYSQYEGVLKKDSRGYRCDAIDVRYESEREYLTEHLAHHVRRAKALNNDDYKSRYKLIGTYRSSGRQLSRTELSVPWQWNASSKELTFKKADQTVRLVCVQGAGRWRAASLTAPILGAKIPNASVRVWVHRTSVGAKTGQITATDGTSFWLFQSISRLGYISADEAKVYAAEGSKKKINKPVIVSHAQRQQPIAPLNAKLLERIRRQPVTSISLIPDTRGERSAAIDNYQIAIPSYGRSGMIADFTLKMLERYKVDPARVTIFVADELTRKLWVEPSKRGRLKVFSSDLFEDQREPALYRERLKDSPYGNQIVVGVKNIGSQRNFIQNYYPEGTHLISIDDDLVKISELFEGRYREIGGARAFRKVVANGFSECHETSSHIWGLYASANEKFQATALEVGEVSYANNYIIASLYGTIVRHDSSLEVASINHAEDQERSLRFFAKDGVLVRLNRFTMSKGSEYFAKGGLEGARSAEILEKKAPFEDSIVKVAKMFPTLCSPYIKKKTARFPYGYWDLRFRRLRSSR